jgi:hypothetical protein
MRHGLLAILTAALLACSGATPPARQHGTPVTGSGAASSSARLPAPPVSATAPPSPSAAAAGTVPLPVPEAETSEAKSVLPEIREQAVRLAALVKTPEAKRFLAQAATLPAVAPRMLYHDANKSHYYTADEAAALPGEARATLKARLADEELYYYTGYGSPLSYARPLDVAFASGVQLAPGSKVLDFGYGYVGHLRMLAGMGLEATGIDVHPLLRALYAAPSDQGEVLGADGAKGHVRLIDGFFPRDLPVVKAVGTGYRFIISKNVLKKGYIHPDRPADDEQLIHLGAPDDVVLGRFVQALEPGGYMLIYNICPALTPPDKPFVPWSDGRSPFTKEQWKAAGFKVLAFDQDDVKILRTFARALEWDKGEDPMDLENDLSVLYTLVRRQK